jgi:hypothetical protein
VILPAIRTKPTSPRNYSARARRINPFWRIRWQAASVTMTV